MKTNKNIINYFNILSKSKISSSITKVTSKNSNFNSYVDKPNATDKLFLNTVSNSSLKKKILNKRNNNYLTNFNTKSSNVDTDNYSFLRKDNSELEGVKHKLLNFLKDKNITDFEYNINKFIINSDNNGSKYLEQKLYYKFKLLSKDIIDNYINDINFTSNIKLFINNISDIIIELTNYLKYMKFNFLSDFIIILFNFMVYILESNNKNSKDISQKIYKEHIKKYVKINKKDKKINKLNLKDLQFNILNLNNKIKKYKTKITTLKNINLKLNNKLEELQNINNKTEINIKQSPIHIINNIRYNIKNNNKKIDDAILENYKQDKIINNDFLKLFNIANRKNICFSDKECQTPESHSKEIILKNKLNINPDNDNLNNINTDNKYILIYYYDYLNMLNYYNTDDYQHICIDIFEKILNNYLLSNDIDCNKQLQIDFIRELEDNYYKTRKNIIYYMFNRTNTNLIYNIMIKLFGLQNKKYKNNYITLYYVCIRNIIKNNYFINKDDSNIYINIEQIFCNLGFKYINISLVKILFKNYIAKDKLKHSINSKEIKYINNIILNKLKHNLQSDTYHDAYISLKNKFLQYDNTNNDYIKLDILRNIFEKDFEIVIKDKLFNSHINSYQYKNKFYYNLYLFDILSEIYNINNTILLSFEKICHYLFKALNKYFKINKSIILKYLKNYQHINNLSQLYIDLNNYNDLIFDDKSIILMLLTKESSNYESMENAFNYLSFKNDFK